MGGTLTVRLRVKGKSRPQTEAVQAAKAEVVRITRRSSVQIRSPLPLSIQEAEHIVQPPFLLLVQQPSTAWLRCLICLCAWQRPRRINPQLAAGNRRGAGRKKLPVKQKAEPRSPAFAPLAENHFFAPQSDSAAAETAASFSASVIRFRPTKLSALLAVQETYWP